MTEGIAAFQQMLWAVNSVTAVVLLALIAVRRNYRVYPAFSFYILANLALGALAFLIYRRWGFTSSYAWPIAWGMQALVVCARALAVTEVCKHLLGRYRGIWGLAWRTLLVCAGLVLLYAGVASEHRWEYVLLKMERGTELAITAVIIVVLLFVRHYEVQPNPADRSLAVGFCLYSCFRALNDTIATNYLSQYLPLWNLVEMLAFFASLLVWTWAVRRTQMKTAPEEVLLPSGVYQVVAPQINDRLRLLNDQLGRLWHAEGKKS